MALFGWEHWLYIILIVGTIVTLALVFAKRSDQTKAKVLNITAVLVITLYLFDFFVQPFWDEDGEIRISKLPFHICTLVGVLIPLVNFNGKCKFARQTVTVWAVLAPLMFILFPLNYINQAVQPYSYPIIQTFVFHGLEIFWGVLMLVSHQVALRWRDIWQPIIGLFAVAAWATLGQELYYPDSLGENFLFLRTDISAYAPQWLYIPALFTAATLAITLMYLVYWLIGKITNHHKNH